MTIFFDNKLKIFLILVTLFGLWIFLASIFSDPVKINASSINSSKIYTIDSNTNDREFDSDIYTANFEFNAIAPSWKENNADETNRHVFIRTSKDKQNWSEWSEVEVIKQQKENAPDMDRLYPEAPIFETGKYFQYKIHLMRKTSDNKNPQINDFKIDYMDSRGGLKQNIKQGISNLFKVYADSTPNIISRTDWGSPDPNGDLYKDDPVHYWTPVNMPVKQFFVHHTADANDSNDFPSVVRAIWQYHAVTLGWGDIGYNYIIDGNGNIYEGRFGGDGVVGGHTLNFNQNSMGVALIGCFQPNNTTCQQVNNNNVTSPSSAMIDSLTTLLAYKARSYEIEPVGTQNFCGSQNCLNLNIIAGHRDAYATACPGDLTYNILDSIRSQTATKKTSLDWSYSAKQIDYPSATIDSNSSTTITLTLKNTGTVTWTNSGNGRMLLKTANAINHISIFKSDSWLDSSTAAALNEANVSPGQNGTFTIKLTSPSNPRSDNFEYFELVSENNWTFKNYFTIPITINIITPTITPSTVIPTTQITTVIPTTPILTPTPIPTVIPTPVSYKNKGDLNGNNKVDLSDLSVLASHWMQSTSIGDVNGDGKVDLSDLSIIAANWGKNF